MELAEELYGPKGRIFNEILRREKEMYREIDLKISDPMTPLKLVYYYNNLKGQIKKESLRQQRELEVVRTNVKNQFMLKDMQKYTYILVNRIQDFLLKNPYSFVDILIDMQTDHVVLKMENSEEKNNHHHFVLCEKCNDSKYSFMINVLRGIWPLISERTKKNGSDFKNPVNVRVLMPT